MYYVWQKNRQAIGKYAHFDKEPSDFQIGLWVNTEKIEADLPMIELETNQEIESIELSDLLLTRFNLQVFSPKLIEVFENLGVGSIDYYDTRIKKHGDSIVVEDYKVAHILTEIHCLDKENSRCKYFTEDSELRDVTKFRLFENEIKSLEGDNLKPLIFRLGEFPFIILVDESVKIRCEKENITGVKFVEPSKYTGF